MPLTNAEKQKAYRARKKEKEGQSYLKKESSRVLKYYVPSQQLSSKDKKKRNARAAIHNRKHREKVKLMQEAVQNENEASGSTSGYGSQEADSRLIVKLPKPAPKMRMVTKKVKRSREVARAKRQLKDAEAEILKLKRKCLAKQKAIERLRKKAKLEDSNTKIPKTPQSQTEAQLQSINVTPQSREKVRRQLLLGNVMLAELSESKKECRKGKKSEIVSVISGKISKKYRCLSALSKATRFSRRCVEKYSKLRWTEISSKKSKSFKRYQKDVEEFMNREDNSRTQPGKKDVKKCEEGVKKQTKVLTDYLANLHQKFLSENPTVKLSLASFCRFRPKNILTAKFISRQACLCIRHQNFALKLQALRKVDVSVSANPEVPIDLNDVDNLMSHLPDTEVIAFKVWKRVENEKKQKRTRIVEMSLQKPEFVNLFKKELSEFQAHTVRLREQYKQIKQLKETLPQHHMIVQMDFAENYQCKSMDEVQSAYWQQTAVTLHPVVAYFIDDEGSLQHKSFVVVSDELAHVTSSVWSFLDVLIPKLKEVDSDLQQIHYWTDSPSSQYRNKTVFHIISEHALLYGITAKWNYFEAGHGKGPCDGLGGTTKRMADESINTGSSIIQDAADFYNWAVNSSMREVTFLWVGEDQCKRKQIVTSSLDIQTVKGTMKFHAVSSRGNNTIAARETSCYCTDCLNGGLCEGWELHRLHVKAPTTPETTDNQKKCEVKTKSDQGSLAADIIVEDNNSEVVARESESTKDGLPSVKLSDYYKQEEFVACVYDSDWYIGIVLEVDDEDEEIHVNFMRKAKALFHWPIGRKDKVWRHKRDILCKIKAPLPSGKSQRFFKLADDDRNNIEMVYGSK